MWKLVRIWILFSWSFLTIGIFLGSWWAYHELGWGGWWFWDPVENASLMPWLLATACIHSITRSKLNFWTLICAQATFLFSILGTFFVRSGLLSSVHSFATDSTRGFYLFIFLLSIILISVVNLFIYQKRHSYIKQQPSPASFASAASRAANEMSCPVGTKKRFFEIWFKRQPKAALEPLKAKKATKGSYNTVKGSLLLKKPILFLEGTTKEHENYTDVLEKKFIFKDNAKSSTIEQIFFLQNFYLCVICVVVLFGTSAPILFQWIWNRDVGTGAPFYNGTLIPLFTSVFCVLAYAHYIQFNQLNNKLPTGKQSNLNKSKFGRLKESFTYNEAVLPIYFYCFLFFIIHVLVCTHIIGLSFLNSIYGAICFLLISAIFLSTEKRFSFFATKHQHQLKQRAQMFSEERSSFANLIYPSSPEKSRLPLHLLSYKKSIGSLLPKDAQAAHKAAEAPKEALENPEYNLREFRSTLVPKCLGALAQVASQSKKEMNIAHTGIVLFITGILLSNTFKVEFTEQLYSGPIGFRLGSQICCLRSIDHSFAPTFHSISANLLVFQYGSLNNRGVINQPELMLLSKLERSEHSLYEVYDKTELNKATQQAFNAVTMFPEKRFFYSNQGAVATKVAIHSNLFTDLYSLIGTGSFETGWFTTIMKLPFIFCIWLGFIFGVFGAFFSLKKLLHKSKLDWI